MSKTAQQISAWQLEGRFLGFIFEEGKPKRLRLMTADGEFNVKLAKPLRASIGATLLPGAWIQIEGETKRSYYLDGTKLKAFRLRLVSPGQSLPTESIPAVPAKPTRPASATILVCQKSDCLKRGGKAVCQALEAALSDRNLTDQVSIRGTGCMKQCKAGPNVVMPDKTRYSRVAARDVAVLMDEQFPCDTQDNNRV